MSEHIDKEDEEIKSNINSIKIKTKNKPPTLLCKKDSIPSQPLKNINFKESSMRLKQTIRINKQINNCINELKHVSSMPKSNIFMIPHTIAQNEKRWKEFVLSTGRGLYVLKRDIHTLEEVIKSTKTMRDDKYHRLLASSARSTLNLIMRLQKFPEELKSPGTGPEILKELIFISSKFDKFIEQSKIYKVIDKNKHHYNIRSKTINLDVDKAMGSKSDNIEESMKKVVSQSDYLVLSSDMDSSVLDNIQPEQVRDKLQQLITDKLPKKKRKQTKKSLNKYKVIQPLSQKNHSEDQKDSTCIKNPKKSPHVPVVEQLPNGRKVQFIHDSLSLKIRPKGLKHPDYYQEHKQLQQSVEMPVIPTQSLKGEFLSEKKAENIAKKAAEDVIDKLYTEFCDKVDKKVESHEIKKFKINDNSEMIQNVKDLIIRCDQVLNRREKFAEFLEEIDRKYNDNNNIKDLYDLDHAIEEANYALRDLNLDEDLKLESMPYIVMDQENIRQDKENIKNDNEKLENYDISSYDVPNINDQIIRQKEQFWLSLFERGFVAEEFIFNYDPLKEISGSMFNGNDKIYPNNTKEIITKETQVGSSLSSSNTQSYESIKENSKGEEGSDSEEESVNHYHSTTSKQNDSDTSDITEDFPSYSGEN